MNFGYIEKHVAFQVHLTWRALRKRLLADIRKAEDPVLRGSYSIPLLIELNPGVAPQELAEALHLDASKIAAVVRDLEKRGFVTRTRSKKDKRMVELQLTTEGREFVQKSHSASEALEVPFSSALNEEERDQLIRLLMKLRNNV